MKKFLFIILGIALFAGVITGEALLLSAAESDHNKSIATASLDTLREDAGLLSSALSLDSSADIDPLYNKLAADFQVFSDNPYVVKNLSDFTAELKSELDALPAKIEKAKTLRLSHERIKNSAAALSSIDFSAADLSAKLGQAAAAFSGMGEDLAALDERIAPAMENSAAEISQLSANTENCSKKQTCKEQELKTKTDSLNASLADLENTLKTANSAISEELSLNSLIESLNKSVF
jgi:chromosome segregation ATPase